MTTLTMPAVTPAAEATPPTRQEQIKRAVRAWAAKMIASGDTTTPLREQIAQAERDRKIATGDQKG